MDYYPPPTSAGRPGTSRGARPWTAASHRHQEHHMAPGYYGHDVYEQMEEEDEGESSDEDVFAFLPPSTAEQQQQQHQQQYLQPPSQTGPERQEAHFPTDPTFAYDLRSHTPTQPFPPPQSPPPSTGSEPVGDHAEGYRMRRLDEKGKQDEGESMNEDPPKDPEVDKPDEYPPHWQHFQPNPARSNPNSGPYRRYREHHYNQAYPQYAIRQSTHEAPETSWSGKHAEASRDHTTTEEEEEDDESIQMGFDLDAIEDEDSPYPEVRASVSNIDDPDMPAMTIRMWFIGLILCIISSALNVFFNFRSPAPMIMPLLLLLVAYPIGKFLAFILPITTYRIPLPYLPARFIPSATPAIFLRVLQKLSFPQAIEFSFNPGPWNIKEHVLVYIMANVAVTSPYALNAIVVLDHFYSFDTGFWFSVVLVLATQMTGFGLAGLCKRFLVWPASMVWPLNLVACTLLNTLHAEDEGEDDGIGMLGGPYYPDHYPDRQPETKAAETGTPPAPTRKKRRQRRKGMSRFRFFTWTTLASFAFFFLPGYLFQALSYFSFVCWAAPNNVVVNQLFGISSGLGMSVLTFDWAQISWIGSPLMVPWWAEAQIFIGFVVFYWIMTPILYYTNSWKVAYFPISDTRPYDRMGEVYNVTKVLRPDDTLDLEAYEAYSNLYLPATYAIAYLLAFCLSTCVIVHTILYHGSSLYRGMKKMEVERDDIHAKLMRNYPEVPGWWYLATFGVFFALAVIAVEVWDTTVPVWSLVLSVALPMIYILPNGFIYAMTGQPINLNILAQIIPGALSPGKPIVNMIFKTYSVQTLAAATYFVQDMKLGHYVKVPPRATFLAQTVATTLTAFIQVGVKQWMFHNVKGICTEDQPSRLTCPHNQVFFTASAIWGLIGPSRQFGPSSIYYHHLYAMVIGVFLPIPFWLLRRRAKNPNSWINWVSTPVILNGVSFIPPATGINYSSWFLVGVIFQYVIRKRNFAWWSKFNYVLSSALDSGTAIAVIVIFFTLEFPKGGVELDWWGNNVFKQTADAQGRAYLPIPPGGIPWKK